MKVRLKELGTISTGNTPSKKVDEYWSNRDIKFIKPDVIKDELCVISSANEHISASAKNVSRIVPANSILVTCIGEIGRVGITEEEVSFNQQINAIVPNEAIIPKYLAYAIYANRKQLKAIANAPVVPIINKTQFSNFEISICESVEKQNKIVRTLDVISEIITHDKKKIEALDELIKARFVEMFGDKDFDKKPFKDVCEELFAGGDVKRNRTVKDADSNHPYAVFTNGEKDGGLYGYTDVARVTRPSITISGRGTIGFCLVRAEPFYPAIRLIVATPKEGLITPSYLKYFIDSKDYSGRGASIPQLTIPMIKDEPVPIPPIEAQKEFELFIAQADKSKFAVQKSLEKTQLLFDSLMQEYFG